MMENEIERYEMMKKAFNDMNNWLNEAKRDKDILTMTVALNIFIEAIEKYVLHDTKLLHILYKHHILYDSERIVKLCKDYEHEFIFRQQHPGENTMIYNLRFIIEFYNNIVGYIGYGMKDYKYLYTELDNFMTTDIWESFHDVILTVISR